ncbi:MAG: hypothetical protein KDA96_02010 [Planctomycetaceae bacterium]|nr:hypothetical protein [Planctomycetaceae bacterium]
MSHTIRTLLRTRRHATTHRPVIRTVETRRSSAASAGIAGSLFLTTSHFSLLLEGSGEELDGTAEIKFMPAR